MRKRTQLIETLRIVQGTDNADELVGTSEDDAIRGGRGNDSLKGGDGNDALRGNSGADQLAGNGGNDTVSGGLGNDLLGFESDSGDDAATRGDEGYDVAVYSGSIAGYSIWQFGDAIVVRDIDRADGNDGRDDIWGFEELRFADATFVFSEQIVADLIDLSAAAGTTGSGGFGNDTYVVDDAADLPIEENYAGTDTVHSSIDWTLGANLEILVLLGAGDLDGKGNVLGNLLIGSAGDNVLEGLGGADTLRGGGGADTLRGGGGGGSRDSLVGGAGDDVLRTSSGLNFIDGGTGNDTLVATGGYNLFAGGNGLDTVVLSANRSDYMFGGFRGLLTIGSPGEHASCVSVETAQFADGVVRMRGHGELVVAKGRAPGVAPLDDGGYVQCWAVTVAGGGIDIHARLFTADGTPLGPGFRVNADTRSRPDFVNPDDALFAVAALGNGFVVAWTGDSEDGTTDVFARVFDSSGQERVPEFRVNETTDYNQYVSSIAPTGNGGFVVSWHGFSFLSTGVARYFDATGVPAGNEIQVTGDQQNQRELKSVVLSDGQLVEVFGALKNDFGGTIPNRVPVTMVSLYDETSDELQTFVIDEPSFQIYSEPVALADGGFAVALYAVVPRVSLVIQRFSSDGTRIGSNIVVTSTLPFTGFPPANKDPALAALGDGGFLVCWSEIGQSVSESDLYAQRYHADGSINGALIRVSTTPGLCNDVAIAALESGGFAISWKDEDGIVSRVFDANGASDMLTVTFSDASDRIDLRGHGDVRAIGGTGDDTYLVNSAGDQVVERSRAGVDSITSSVSFTLPPNVEKLILASDDIFPLTNGLLADQPLFSGTGNLLANVLRGDAQDNALFGLVGRDLLRGAQGDDLLDGGAGADTLHGGAGDDRFIIDHLGDVVVEQVDGGSDTLTALVDGLLLPGDVEVMVLAASDVMSGSGNAVDNSITGNEADNTIGGGGGNDTLVGGIGNDVLDGGPGIDSLLGGTGNDLYRVDHAEDAVVELPGEGNDTIESSADIALSANVENLVLTGTAIVGFGNQLDNHLTGNSSVNVLTGNGGADTLAGGAGDDYYVIDSSNDVIIEAAGEGNDIVLASATYVLGAHLENLKLTGDRSIDAVGNALDNLLIGNNADNLLDGEAGSDTASYEAASDAVTVDLSVAAAQPTGGGGTDTLLEIENLIGSAYADTLSGSAEANTIDGGAGTDTMAGGDGDDTYYVDDVDDETVEQAAPAAVFDEPGPLAGGTNIDTVIAQVSYTLRANIENLTLTSSGIAATGNELNNILIGNARANTLKGLGGRDLIGGGDGNDTIDGGDGSDTVSGGFGDDTFLVGAGDRINEFDVQGIDTVRASVSWTLGSTLEHLELTSGALDGAGNGGANRIHGNAADNALNGAGGSDTLVGGAGRDILTGGAGADTFWFTAALGSANVDSVRDFGAVDRLALDDDVFKQFDATVSSSLAAENFWIGTAAHDADDRIIYNSATGALFYDADGTGPGAAIRFATLGTTTHPTLTAEDFVIVA